MHNNQIESILLDQTDGPVTKYVIIFRSIKLARETDVFYDSDIADTLNECLQNYEYLPSNEFSRFF